MVWVPASPRKRVRWNNACFVFAAALNVTALVWLRREVSSVQTNSKLLILQYQSQSAVCGSQRESVSRLRKEVDAAAKALIHQKAATSEAVVAAEGWRAKVEAASVTGVRTQPSKKVISFTLFHKHGLAASDEIPEWLLVGLERNRQGWRFYLPDWIMRVYIGPGVSQKVVKSLIHTATMDPFFEIVQLHPAHNISNGNNEGAVTTAKWESVTMSNRFLIADDPTVERYIVRDLDGRPSLRELLAINDWIRSGRSFHCIRDHLFHHSVPIMGGMWGGTNELFSRLARRENTTKLESMASLLAQYKQDGVHGSFTDQTFLQMFLWSRVAADTWAHDIWAQGRRPDTTTQVDWCKASGGCHLIPESVRWDEFFIGAPWKIFDSDEEITRRAATRDYKCWSTCTMGPPMDCACSART